MRTGLRTAGRLAPVLTCLALFILFSVMTPTFFSRDNVVNILQQNSVLAIMAVGVTFVLLCAEIDLSIAFMATLSGVIAAMTYVSLSSVAPGWFAQTVAIGAAIGACAALGYVNGLGTARLGLPSFMMTIAMSLIAKGLALRLTLGKPIFTIPPVADTLGTGSIDLFRRTSANGAEFALVSIPNIIVVAAVFLAAGGFVLRYTRFGRHVYMVGGNRQAAELAGINVKAITTACLCVCGLTAGISGVILIGRMGSAQAKEPEGMLIGCISAVVLGGTSLFGGKGGIGNTVIGLLTFGILYNGLNHVDINIYLKECISGMILLGALALNIIMARTKEVD